MRTLVIVLVATFAFSCATVSTPPAATELPSFQFSSLRAAPVSVAVFDQREGQERDPAWESRVDSDLRKALQDAGVQIASDATTRIEIRLLRARSDFAYRNWKACVEISGRLVGPQTVEAVGDSCVTKANFFGTATADKALRLAYQDALGKVLSALGASAH
jgi:hypothetical protein